MLRNFAAAVRATEEGNDPSFNLAAQLTGQARERLATDQWLARSEIDKPANFTGQPGKGGERVKAFMQELKRYFIVTDLPVSAWGIMPAHFLTGAALTAFELEFEEVTLSGALTWDAVCKFLKDQYDFLQPVTEICVAYDAMRQGDFDSIMLLCEHSGLRLANWRVQ